MIPKIIHYCWLSNDPIPESLKRCMKSWRRVLPDYEFVLWNFERFPKEQSKWVAEAFDNRKYAFAADYIRLYALYNYGGIYLDMDVEVLKPFDDLLNLHSMICWQKDAKGLEVATFGTKKGAQWIKDCLDYYNGRDFVRENNTYDTTPLPDIVEDTLISKGYNLCTCESIEKAHETEQQANDKTIAVLESSFFSPRSYDDAHIALTDNSYSIHHFAGTWLPWYSRLKRKIFNMLGLRNVNPFK